MQLVRVQRCVRQACSTPMVKQLLLAVVVVLAVLVLLPTSRQDLYLVQVGPRS